MKKVLLAFASACIVCAVSAQTVGEHLGIRAGLNVASLSGDHTDNYKSKAGFHLGIVDQFAVSQAHPLYLETGLYLTGKGYKYSYGDEDDTYDVKGSLTYLQVPVLAVYKLAMEGGYTLEPFAGLYYGYGISGKEKESDEPDYELFKKEEGMDASMKRSDLGLRLGVGVSFDRYYAGLGYEIGLSNISNESRITSHNNCFTISVGYNF